jgi:hypothetical protein
MAVPTPTRGAEEGDARPRRGWPPSAVAAISRLARDSARLRSWRRRNPLTEPMLMLVGPSQEGGGLCRPVNAPALESQQERGVVQERPRLRIAVVAPGSFSGVAPRVSVGDALGRACRPQRMLSANAHEPDLELNPREISNLPRFSGGSRHSAAPTFPVRHPSNGTKQATGDPVDGGSSRLGTPVHRRDQGRAQSSPAISSHDAGRQRAARRVGVPRRLHGTLRQTGGPPQHRGG